MESILTSVKKMLGIEKEYTHFDQDIIMHINTVLSILTQIGVGPSTGFSIQDENAIWSDFVPANPLLEPIKTYTYLKVKLIFDPPLSSAVTESYNRTISELESRISYIVDPGEGKIQNG
jgi:hypothetical protein